MSPEEKEVKEENNDYLKDNKSTKRTLTALFEAFEARKIPVDKVKKNIARTCSRSMQVMAPMITHKVREWANSEEINGQPFQILGFDLMIDAKLKAWILEVNAGPSLNICFQTEEINSVGKKVKTQEEGDFDPVDMFVKTRVVSDAVNLARLQELPEQFNSL